MTEPASTPAGLGPDHGYGPDIDHVLLSEEQIQAKIRELAEQVARDYAGREVLLVGVLKGAVLFMSDFARALQLPTQMEFMAVSSYGSATSSSGVVRILKDLDALDSMADAELTRWGGDLPADEVAALPAALRRRVLRGWLRAAAVPDLQAVHLGAVDALLTRWRGQGRVDLPGGAGVVRTSGRPVLQPPVGRGSGPRSAADDPEEPLP